MVSDDQANKNRFSHYNAFLKHWKWRFSWSHCGYFKL